MCDEGTVFLQSEGLLLHLLLTPKLQGMEGMWTS